MVEVCDPIHLATGESANAILRYFDYGVVSLEIEMQFENDCLGLIALTNRWIEAGEVEQRGLKSVRERAARVQSAQRKPHAEWLDEAYYVVHLRGREIGQVIRGESQALSEAEQKEVLPSCMTHPKGLRRSCNCWSMQTHSSLNTAATTRS